MAKKNTGKLREKVVTILERHLEQNARVCCDRKLPVLKKPSRKRQIDVLIETGEERRKTISIVETQDRIDKPDQSEFDGWLVKMREVGAQHLICVTSAGYPQSIIDKAKEEGPTVRLYTLKQLEEGGEDIFPPTFIMNTSMQIVTYGKLHQVEAKLEGERLYRVHHDLLPGQELDPDYKMFWPDDHHEPVSPIEVADWHFFRHPQNIAELPHTGEMVRVKFQYRNIFKWKTADGWVKLERFHIIVDVSVEDCPIIWEESRYEAVGVGEAGWILKGTAVHKGKTKQLYVPFRTLGDGLYSAGRAVSMSEDDTFFMAYGDVGHQAEVFSAEPPNKTASATKGKGKKLQAAIRRALGKEEMD